MNPLFVGRSDNTVVQTGLFWGKELQCKYFNLNFFQFS